MSFSVNITKRVRTRRLRDGSVVKQARWVANYIDPCQRQAPAAVLRDAQGGVGARTELVAHGRHRHLRRPAPAPTIAEALDHWLEDKAAKVKANTLAAATGRRRSYRAGLGQASKA